MIVVNSVMAGFSSEMRGRIHGILSDMVLEATSMDGTPMSSGKCEPFRRPPATTLKP